MWYYIPLKDVRDTLISDMNTSKLLTLPKTMKKKLDYIAKKQGIHCTTLIVNVIQKFIDENNYN